MDIVVRTTFHHRQMLRFIALHGGQIEFEFGYPGPHTEASDKSIREMESSGMITITPIVGSRKSMLRLADIGRNIITQLGIPIKERNDVVPKERP